jgi:stage II sporulation protein D
MSSKSAVDSLKYPLIILLSILLFSLNCAGKPIQREIVVPPNIRESFVSVNILETNDVIFVNSHEPYLLKWYKQGTGWSREYRSYNILIRLSDRGEIMIDSSLGALETGIRRVSFVPEITSTFIYLNGKPYRGGFEILLNTGHTAPYKSKSLIVLNIVHLEDYLKGVVPAEIGSLGREEMEALKTQAIAARTYALSRLGQYEEGRYDLMASVEDQVYKGVEGENSLVSQAILETEDIVLTYGGEPIDAYYHSNCGGRTAFIERIWEKPEEPYLIPVTDDYCSWSKNYHWEETWDRSDLENNLAAYLDTLVTFSDEGFGTLEDLEVLRRSPSGRVEILEVTTAEASYKIYKDKIRWAMRKGSDNSRILASTFFNLEIYRDAGGSIISVKATGHGAGHGVGMCQTGAIGMARNGYDFQEILSFFYKNAELGRWRER